MNTIIMLGILALMVAQGFELDTSKERDTKGLVIWAILFVLLIIHFIINGCGA